MIYALAFYCIAGAILTWIILTAPEGWEDSDGFHYGEPE